MEKTIKVPCKTCLVLAICKNKDRIECSAMFDRLDGRKDIFSEDDVLEMLDLFSKDEITIRKPGYPGEWVISRREDNKDDTM